MRLDGNAAEWIGPEWRYERVRARVPGERGVGRGNGRLRVPAVVRAIQRKTKHGEWRRKRIKLQRGFCFYCACKMDAPGSASDVAATLDHVEPLARGGADHWENTRAACRRCNLRKGDDDVKTFQLGRK